MKVIAKSTMPDGTAIQIEDWHDNYSFMSESATVAAYPVAKVGLPGSFAPKGGERFRAAFDFNSPAEAKEVFEKLEKGEKNLSDYAAHIERNEYAACL
jgi:hypothetical protein